PPRPSTFTSVNRPKTLCPLPASRAVSRRHRGQPPSGESAGISLPQFRQTLLALIRANFSAAELSGRRFISPQDHADQPCGEITSYCDGNKLKPPGRLR